MKDKIELVIMSCEKTYQLIAASKYTFLAYRGNRITTKEYVGFKALIGTYYQLLEDHSQNQFGNTC